MAAQIRPEIDQTVKEYEEDNLFRLPNNDKEENYNNVLQQLAGYTHRSPNGAVGDDYWCLHNNPLLQGCVVLDKLLNYMQYSNKAMNCIASFMAIFVIYIMGCDSNTI